MRREFLSSGLMLAFATVAAHPAGAARCGDPRLCGRWRSNRERTLEELPASSAPRRVAVLAGLLGKFEWQFTETTWIVQEGDPAQGAQTAVYPMRIVGSDERSVVLEVEALNRKSLQQVFVSGDWLHAFNGHYAEYFKRIAA